MNIFDLQQEYKACPMVYGVWVRCDGEESLLDLYDTREAAEHHMNCYNVNNRRGYYGKARILGHRIGNAAIVHKRFPAETEVKP